MLKPLNAVVPPLSPYCVRDNLTIYHGDCLELLPQFAENSIATWFGWGLSSPRNYRSAFK